MFRGRVFKVHAFHIVPSFSNLVPRSLQKIHLGADVDPLVAGLGVSEACNWKEKLEVIRCECLLYIYPRPCDMVIG